MRRRVPTPHGPRGPPLPCHDPPHRGRTRLLSCRDVTHPGHSAASWRPRREELRGLQERVLLLPEGMAATTGVTLLVLLLSCGQGAELPPINVTSGTASGRSWPGGHGAPG